MPTKNILYIQEYKQIEGKRRWKKPCCHKNNNKENRRAEVALSNQKKNRLQTQTVNRDKKQYKGF